MSGGFFTLKGIQGSPNPFSLTGTEVAIYVDKINQLDLTANATLFSDVVLNSLNISANSVPNMQFDVITGQDALKIFFNRVSTTQEAVQILRIFAWLKWGTDGDTFTNVAALLEQEYINSTARISLVDTLPIRIQSNTDVLIRVLMLPGIDNTSHIQLLTDAFKEDLGIEIPVTGTSWLQFESDEGSGSTGVLVLRQIFPNPSLTTSAAQASRVKILSDGSKIVSLLKKGVFNQSAIVFSVLSQLDSMTFPS